MKKIPDRVFDSDFDSDEGQTERLFIASSLTNRAADLLESGRFHLWRGLLNPIGEELLKLINNEVNYAKECGRVSQEWVDKFYKDLNKNISKVG